MIGINEYLLLLLITTINLLLILFYIIIIITIKKYNFNRGLLFGIIITLVRHKHNRSFRNFP